MSTLMEQAIDSLRRDVPPDRQDEIARIIMGLTGHEDGLHLLTSEEEADLDAADTEVARGDVATEDQMRSIWAKHGL